MVENWDVTVLYAVDMWYDIIILKSSIFFYNIILNPNSKSKNKKIKRKENINKNRLSLPSSILTI